MLAKIVTDEAGRFIRPIDIRAAIQHITFSTDPQAVAAEMTDQIVGLVAERLHVAATREAIIAALVR